MFLWFGDSWAAGVCNDESTQFSKHGPARTDGPDRDIYRNYNPVRLEVPEKAYPALVSNWFGKDMVSFALGGSSLQQQVWELIQFVKNEWIEDVIYDVILSTTGVRRYFSINDNNSALSGMFDPEDVREGNIDLLTHADTAGDWWSATFNYETTLLLNSFWLTCREYGMNLHIIEPWSVNKLHTGACLVPEYQFMLESMKVEDPNDFRTLANRLEFEGQWLIPTHDIKGLKELNQRQLQEITTCSDGFHPNNLGHKIVASNIINKLEERL